MAENERLIALVSLSPLKGPCRCLKEREGATLHRRAGIRITGVRQPAVEDQLYRSLCLSFVCTEMNPHICPFERIGHRLSLLPKKV